MSMTIKLSTCPGRKITVNGTTSVETDYHGPSLGEIELSAAPSLHIIRTAIAGFGAIMSSANPEASFRIIVEVTPRKMWPEGYSRAHTNGDLGQDDYMMEENRHAPELHSFCEMSQDHLTHLTMLWLDDQVARTDDGGKMLCRADILVGRMPGGWFMHANEDPEPPIPEDLARLMKYARKIGSEYVFVDDEAEHAFGLPLLSSDRVDVQQDKPDLHA